MTIGISGELGGKALFKTKDLTMRRTPSFPIRRAWLGKSTSSIGFCNGFLLPVWAAHNWREQAHPPRVQKWLLVECP
jgi:xanthine dehydrogenase iron-sulfur cluster and FAD-binding subunit A